MTTRRVRPLQRTEPTEPLARKSALAPGATPARDSEATRSRILEAAKVRFSQCSYEGVGVREIAALAHADPALVIRYFGSKQGLFRAVAEQAFDAADLLEAGIDSLPQHATRLLTGSLDSEAWRSGYDPLRLLLCSIGSATAGPILGEFIAADLVRPLADAMQGRHTRERASMLVAHIMGFALMRVALAHGDAPALQPAALRSLLKSALAAAATPP